MKNEKRLLALPWEPAPEVEQDARYAYRCDRVGEDVIAVTIYDKNRKPIFRSFTSENQIRSQEYKSQKPLSSTLSNYLCRRGMYYIYYGEDRGFGTDERSCGAASEWLGEVAKKRLDSSSSPILAVSKYQQDIRKRELEAIHKRIRDSIDEKMLEIKPLPKRFDKWIDECVMKKSRYIVYQSSSRKRKKGYCTYCKDFVEVEGARHKAFGKCPKCNSGIIFIAAGFAPSTFADNNYCAYIQPDKNGEPIYRSFRVWRTYRKKIEDGMTIYEAETVSREEERFFEGGKKSYTYGDFKNTGVYRFCEDVINVEYSWKKMVLYPYNMGDVFKSKAENQQYLKYIPFVKFLKKNEVDPKRFYRKAIKMPALEFFIKYGLMALAADVVNSRMNWGNEIFAEGKSLKEVFPQGATRDELRLFKKLDIRLSELRQYYNHGRVIGAKKFIDGIKLYREDKALINECFELLKYATANKIVKYIAENVCKENEKRPAWNRLSHFYFANDWLDYLKNADKLGWNTRDDFIVFPRDFNEAHDRAARLAKIEEEREMDEAVASAEAKINLLYKYESKKYVIRAPHDAQEIVSEGQLLHHCVATYLNRVVKEETNILFMRSKDKPDEPLYTIEVRDGELIQVRGKRNSNIKDQAEKNFFEKWKKIKLENEKRKAV